MELIDLNTSGILALGTQLTRVELDDQVHNSVSAAAMTLTRGIPTSGWHFFLVDPITKRRLSHLYKEYLAQRSIEDDDDDEDDDDEE